MVTVDGNPRLQKHSARFTGTIKIMTDDDWKAIIDGANEYLKEKGKKAIPVIDVDASEEPEVEFVLVSDPPEHVGEYEVDDDDVM